MAAEFGVQVWQSIAQSAQFLATALVGFLAWRIGVKQNQINARILDLQDSVVVVLMPVPERSGSGKTMVDRLTIMNGGTRPAFLVSYTINGAETPVTATVAPTMGYGIPIYPRDAPSGQATVLITYEDMHNRRYISKSHAHLTSDGWVTSTERNQLQK